MVKQATLLKIAAGTFVVGSTGLYLAQKVVQYRVRSLPHYAESLRIVEGHEQAKEALGLPISVGAVDLSDNRHNYVAKQKSALRIPVTGSLDCGFMDVMALRENPEATFRTSKIRLLSNMHIYLFLSFTLLGFAYGFSEGLYDFDGLEYQPDTDAFLTHEKTADYYGPEYLRDKILKERENEQLNDRFKREIEMEPVDVQDQQTVEQEKTEQEQKNEKFDASEESDESDEFTNEAAVNGNDKPGNAGKVAEETKEEVKTDVTEQPQNTAQSTVRSVRSVKNRKQKGKKNFIEKIFKVEDSDSKLKGIDL